MYAFQFSPLEQTFGSSGVDTQRTYTIVNDSDEDIAVRISVLERDMDEFGNEVRSETPSSEFLLTPSHVIVLARALSWSKRCDKREGLPSCGGADSLFHGFVPG